MSKVITFSRTFPAYHSKVGQPTFFVEKFWKSYLISETDIDRALTPLTPFIQDYFSRTDWNFGEFSPKNHTIRVGSRWKVGEYFSPRVWSGKPYNSPQIKIAPDTLIKKIYDFEMDLNGVYSINGKYIDEKIYAVLALNDGLTEEEMQYWFMPNFNKPKEFKGQIICWNDKINY